MADRTFDIRLDLGAEGADFALESGGLAVDQGLETAVLLSLFSDRRALADDVLPDDSADRRGWWADDPDDPSGSRLWLLTRSKVTEETATRLRRSAEEALAWLVEDGIASRVSVTTEIHTAGYPQRIDLEIEIARGTATRWSSLWDAVGETVYPAPGVRLQLVPA